MGCFRFGVDCLKNYLESIDYFENREKKMRNVVYYWVKFEFYIISKKICICLKCVGYILLRGENLNIGIFNLYV